jgi:hypothetical protein
VAFLPDCERITTPRHRLSPRMYPTMAPQRPERDNNLMQLIGELRKREGVHAPQSEEDEPTTKLWDDMERRWWSLVRDEDSPVHRDWPAFLKAQFTEKLPVFLFLLCRFFSRFSHSPYWNVVHHAPQ